MSPSIAFACAESVLLSSPESTPELFQQPTFAAPVLASRTAGGLKSLADRARERRKSGGVKQQQAGGRNTLAVVVEEEGRGVQDNTSSKSDPSSPPPLPFLSFGFKNLVGATKEASLACSLYTSNIELTLFSSLPPPSLPSSLQAILASSFATSPTNLPPSSSTSSFFPLFAILPHPWTTSSPYVGLPSSFSSRLTLGLQLDPPRSFLSLPSFLLLCGRSLHFSSRSTSTDFHFRCSLY